MHRSSESVAALASALAKAQAELINPEKSLTATIRSGRTGEGEQTFRYAPLSSGLDIVRKTLGQHEIAIVQTTAIDQAAGMVNLTTLLAHASGEWIASEWPVCPITDMAAPRRMGAALTYARRYALFALVGIAGEDDLDAPDLNDCVASSPGSTGQSSRSSQPTGNGQASGALKGSNPVVLNADQSASLRDKLNSEVAAITSIDLATTWARGVLAAKNSLTAADSKLVEDAFEHRLSEISECDLPEGSSERGLVVSPGVVTSQEPKGAKVAADRPLGIDKSALAIGTPRRYRNKEHLRYVSQQACLLCARKPSDPHHLRFVQPRAMGRKASDEFAVPLCRIHHRAVHRAGDERAWWKNAGVDPIKVARKLWKSTRSSEERSRPIPTDQRTSSNGTLQSNDLDGKGSP